MAKQKTHSFPCSFKGFGSNKGSARIAVEVARPELEIDEALGLFINSEHRVKMKADVGRNGDAEGQQTMIDTTIELSTVGRIRRFSVGKDDISFSINMSSAGLDMNELAKIANAKGMLTLERLGEIPGPKRGADETDEGDDE